MASPFLKWAGGKAKLAPYILGRLPQTIGRYHEPFVGGGAVFFALHAAGRLGPARLADSNAELIECFQVVRDSPLELVGALGDLAHSYARRDPGARTAFYLAQRAAVPLDPVARAARLIFLNKTCYNGLYRVNRRGEFNVPHGRYANPRICDAETIRLAAQALRGCDLAAEDFATACEAARPGDLVYLDPPYHPLTQTARFTSYTRDDFGAAEQARLRDTFDALTARGVYALLSNSEHPSIRDLYSGRGYTIEAVEMSRAINSVGSRRSPVPELLISNFGLIRT